MAWIPYGTQSIDSDDRAAVDAVLASDFLTQGPQVPAFEAAFAQRVHALEAVATHNATSALYLSCLALGLQAGDTLWTSPNSFVASANVGLMCGAQVDFVDIELESGLMSMTALAGKLAQAAQAQRLPKVVMPVHFAGQSCDMHALHALAQRYGFAVIEDASHAVGGAYQQEPIGACQYSDITVFSFHPVKIMTTGEGGMATTQNPKLAQKLRLLRSHGVTRDPQLMTHHSSSMPWMYEQVALGINARMTDIQAALGRTQLTKVDDFLNQRRAQVARYQKRLHPLPLSLPDEQEGRRSAWHLFCVRLADEATRQRVFLQLKAKNIGVNVHYIPIHTQPFYQRLGFRWGDFPQAEAWYAQALTLPLHPKLTSDQQDWVMACLEEAIA